MAAARLPKFTEVLATVHRSGVLELRLNTPENLNSMTVKKYRDLVDGLHFARDDKDISAVVLTANGRFFSSGAVLAGPDRLAPNSPGLLGAKEYISTLIDFPKLIATALQGPAFGIAVTTLPYFDLVYAAPEATFTTPFSRIGVNLEACSSVTFPPIFGPSMTTRLLQLSQTISPKELEYTGLFREILPKEGIQEAVVEKVAQQIEGLSRQSFAVSKSLLRSPEVRAHLHSVNDREISVISKTMETDEHKEYLQKFFDAQKAKSKKAKEAKL
ncbi:Enoyl-CoA delta isomerase 2, mitochondrial [Vanrija pseudolonga]|uniref:Enoyl-CoA delta isomerase 2, mitochondrial n=1 Tax=Vanrija pseudolonga TaxID=143232 RepID=A0AAF1BK35_9TREE|nr:Enoyl-CoA delta isomerase 2, mitochondrial [Vanrija pseudolonga]